jgi:hypothetical protein
LVFFSTAFTRHAKIAKEDKPMIPELIYGTDWKKEHTAHLVEKAARYGFAGIDTVYQPKHDHEEGVSEA